MSTSSINRYLLAGLLIVLAGCNKSPTSMPSGDGNTPNSASPAPSEAVSGSSPSASATATPAVQDMIISAESLGVAKLGMTLGALKQQLPTAEFSVKSPFMVDFDAIAVSEGGATQFYILYLASETFTDEDTIQGLLTDNPEFQTAQGVGPGSSIEQAEQAYGQATLSFNTQNESREYVRFERQPAPNISFGTTGSNNQEMVGVYSSPTGEFNETQQFQTDAKIQSVLLVCLSDGCVPPLNTPSP